MVCDGDICDVCDVCDTSVAACIAARFSKLLGPCSPTKATLKGSTNCRFSLSATVNWDSAYGKSSRQVGYLNGKGSKDAV
mmetsp:Transcript_401/g.798  ORF Transcript_401/g.798 Transcript_401/m.798 type:complete len:80 (+) Transcript_401:262-501(+)